MKKMLFSFVILLLMCVNVRAVVVNPNDVGNSTYIIGEHMFTRHPNSTSPYNGVLTADYIMYAAKTIDSDEFEDMIIYYKNARGNWINAITNEDINPPQFAINYKDVEFFAPEMTVCKGTTNGFNCSTVTDHPDYLDWYYELNGTTLTYYIDTVLPDSVSSDDVTFEVYEKNSTLPLEKDATNHIRIELELGETKTFVSRYYKIGSDGERAYSDYSNELVLGSETINQSIYGTPVLSKESISYNGEYFVVDMANTSPNKCRHVNTIDICDMEYGELYEKNGENVSTPITSTFNFADNTHNYINIAPGENKTYAIRGYLINNKGQKVYTNYSNELNIDFSEFDGIAKPVITLVNSEPDTNLDYVRYEIQIDNQDDYNNKYKYYIDYLDGGDLITNSPVAFNAASILTLHKTATTIAHAHIVYEDAEFTIDGEISEPLAIISKPVLSVEETDNYYQRELSINSDDYCTTNGCSIDYYEIFEMDGDEPIHVAVVNNPSDTYTITLSNESQKYVAKVFMTDQDGIEYESLYSDEVTVDCSIPTPTLSIVSGSNGNEFTSYDNVEEKYTYTLKINSEAYEYNNSFMAPNYDIFDKENDFFIVAGNVGENVTVTIPNGGTKTFYARAYYTDNGNKVYGPASNDVEVITVAVPTLTTNGYIKYENNKYSTGLIVTSSTTSAAPITKYDVNTRLGSLVNTDTEYDIDADIEVADATPGQRFDYKVRAKSVQNGVTRYSAYSSVVSVGYATYAVPTIELLGNIVEIDGNYKLEIKVNPDTAYYVQNAAHLEDSDIPEYTKIVTGIDVYEKDGDNYTPIASTPSTTGIGAKFDVPSSFVGQKTYVAKIYAMNTTNNKIGPEAYSNEVVFNASN